MCLFIIIDASSAHEKARKVYKRQGSVRAALPLPRCYAVTAFALLSTLVVQKSARDLFTLNSIKEIFRNEVPNVGSLVKNLGFPSQFIQINQGVLSEF